MAETKFTGVAEARVKEVVPPTRTGDENIIAAVSYLMGFFTGIVIYLLYKDKSKFISFHAMQSNIVSVAMFVVYMVLLISIVGWLILPFFALASLVLWVWMMYMAYKGEKYKLPYVGEMAEKYA